MENEELKQTEKEVLAMLKCVDDFMNSFGSLDFYRMRAAQAMGDKCKLMNKEEK